MSKVRLRLKAYDHRVLDTAVARLIETVKRTGFITLRFTKWC